MFFSYDVILLRQQPDVFREKKQRNVLLSQIICIFASAIAKIVGYGVTVTLQILVLSFLVRIQVAQRKVQKHEFLASFFVYI